MISVTLDKASAIKGCPIHVQITSDKVNDYGQIQIEVFDLAVQNPIPKLGFGTAPKKIGTDIFEVTIDTNHLELGLYEIRLIKFHSTDNLGVPSQLDFVPTRDYERKVFEITTGTQHPRTVAEILTEAEQLEFDLEQKFLTAIDIRSQKDGPADEYLVFVFIKNLLIGTRIRLEHFEIAPTGNGLDSKDCVDFVNEFLRTQTTFKNLSFNYEDSLRLETQQNNPVCVVHFPALIALNFNQAKDYCIANTKLLLKALSLMRDAGGMIFDVFVLKHSTGEALKYSVTDRYTGNLLTGSLSGEDPDRLMAYLAGLQNSPKCKFLTALFMDAGRERNADFKYVRYWQILEILAESRNYDENVSLVDYDSSTMGAGDNQAKLTKGSLHIVFTLLRENKIGDALQTWEKVNIWFAFRHAVVHYGSISEYTNLSRPNIRTWAAKGYQDIQLANGNDPFLYDLKENVRVLLMRELVANQGRD